MYKLSRDYKKLYDLLNNGLAVICFVDYKGFKLDLPAYRDICQAKKINDTIHFVARGICYGAIEPWNPHTYEYFKDLCNHINIEWVKG